MKDIRKHPRFDIVLVWGTLIDISKKAFSIALFGDNFEPVVETLEYDYHMLELKKFKMLRT